MVAVQVVLFNAHAFPLVASQRRARSHRLGQFTPATTLAPRQIWISTPNDQFKSGWFPSLEIQKHDSEGQSTIRGCFAMISAASAKT